ncbi:MAG: SpoIIE family protein phosphatase [Bacteroidetes bacterium]|jgi:ligand-binding sensor domain-containing protein/serine phosphatase RsbU (regulator of sigma subunit)|nr:SpoIIE family protein phosphatase [Bacteroidota bacterium]
MKRKLSSIFFGLCLMLIVQANNFSLYTINEGLSHNNITYLYTDSRGLLWIGTPDGLNVFDGYDFRTYYHDPDDSNSLSNNYIRHITEDNHGNLWISTNRGVNKFNYGNDRFSTVTFKFNLGNELKKFEHQVIYSVLIDRKNPEIIWIRSYARLFKHNVKTQKTVYYQLPEKEEYDIFQKAYDNLLQDEKGVIYTLVNDGIISVNKDTSTIIGLAEIVPSGIPDKTEVIKLLKVQSGQLFFSVDKKLYQLTIETERINEIFESDLPLEYCEINRQNEFMGFTNQSYTITPLDKLPSTTWNAAFYSEGVVNSVTHDNSDIIWLGTNSGLKKFDLKNKPFHARNGFGHDILTFYEDDTFLYIGQNEDGIVRINKENDRVNRELYDLTVYKITRNSDNVLYAATNKGVLIKASHGSDWVNIADFYNFQINTVLQSDIVYDISIDSDNNIWFGTRKGLYCVNRQEDALYEYQYFFNGADTTSFNSVYEIHPVEEENELCLGTSEGFMVFVKDSEYYESYQSILKDNTFQWYNNSVYNIHHDSAGIYWLGTPNGLYKFNRKTKEFKRFSSADGFQNHFIASMIADNDNNLWLGTHKGLIRFNMVTYKINNFGISDGIGDLLYQRNAVYKNNDGRFYFGGNKITYFNPDSVMLNRRKPQTMLTSFVTYLEGRPVEKNIEVGDTIYLTYQHDNFIVELAADDFTNPEKNQFLYSFEPAGKVEQWQSTGFQNLAIVPKYDPGTYTFRAKASNNHGVWDETGIWFTVKIQTPIWRTTVAYLVYFSIFIGLVYAVFLSRTRQLRKANRIYKERELIAAEIANQKEELSLKNKNITASINYAKRIQQAMMPSEKLFHNVLPNAFVLHKPKDIVSGDFYWINKLDNRIYVAAVDCTGHGVPGAFMSIIGIELFRKITNTPGFNKPGEILDRLKDDFATIFKDVENITLRDGMDIALCIIDEQKKMIEYAGAFNPMYVIRDNRIIEIKADRFSIGLDESDFGEHHFRNNELRYEKGDMLYLFSDGYADQFGGPEGKKFKYRRFRHLLLTLHHLPLDKQKEFLERSIIEWKGDLDQVDDILVMGINL